MDLERDHARRQSLAAARGFRDGATAVLGVQQQARVAPARLRVCRQHRLDPRGEIGHRRIRIGQRARRAHGRACAAADAQVRLDRDAIAIGANRERRADVDALRAPGLARTAVRAQRCLEVEEFRLLEFAGQRGEFGRPPSLAPRRRRPARNSPAAAGAGGTTRSCADRARDRSARCVRCQPSRSRSRPPHRTPSRRRGGSCSDRGRSGSSRRSPARGRPGGTRCSACRGRDRSDSPAPRRLRRPRASRPARSGVPSRQDRNVQPGVPCRWCGQWPAQLPPAARAMRRPSRAPHRAGR